MYIATLTSNLRCVGLGKKAKVVTELGKFKGKNITIRKEVENGIVTEKQFMFSDDNSQKIINKVRNKQGKFERIV